MHSYLPLLLQFVIFLSSRQSVYVFAEKTEKNAEKNIPLWTRITELYHYGYMVNLNTSKRFFTLFSIHWWL